jgi:hypothetical protein
MKRGAVGKALLHDVEDIGADCHVDAGIQRGLSADVSVQPEATQAVKQETPTSAQQCRKIVSRGVSNADTRSRAACRSGIRCVERSVA